MSRAEREARYRERRRGLWRLYRAGQKITLGRPAWCGRFTPRDWVNGGSKTPEVWLSEGGRARYRRLAYCESVWSCPMCAERITSGRAREVQRVVDAQRRAGGDVALITYTVRHARGDDLRKIVRKLRLALRRMKSRRDYRLFREVAGYEGSIRAIEVTYSDAHGWHAHIHEIWLIRPGLIVDVDRAGREGYALWARAAASAGLETDRRGYDLQAGARVVGEYLTSGATWGLGAELARLPAKRGDLGPAGDAGRPYRGATPMEILARAVAGEARAVALWLEYTRAMHGQRQLWWSHGLAARFAEQDTLLDPPADPGERCVLALDGPEWRAVIQCHAEAALLEAAELGGVVAAEALLAEVVAWVRARAPPPALN